MKVDFTYLTHGTPSIKSTSHADAKGRVIGLQLTVDTVRLVERPEDAPAGMYMNSEILGDVFEVRVQLTKNAKSFGASQPRHLFATMDEVNAFFARRFEDVSKKAWKDADRRMKESVAK